MFRIVLRSIAKQSFCNAKLVAETKASTQVLSLDNSEAELYNNLINEANQAIALNLAQSEEVLVIQRKRTWLNKSSRTKILSPILIAFLGCYQAFAGTYSYYCIGGTFALSIATLPSIVLPDLLNGMEYVQTAHLTNDGYLKIFTNQNRTFYIPKEEADLKKIANNETITINDGVSDVFISTGSYINRLKLNEI